MTTTNQLLKSEELVSTTSPSTTLCYHVWIDAPSGNVYCGNCGIDRPLAERESKSKEVWVKIDGHWFQSMQTVFKISPSFDEEDASLFFADTDEVEAISLTHKE